VSETGKLMETGSFVFLANLMTESELESCKSSTKKTIKNGVFTEFMDGQGVNSLF
jgi:hypothetical protein